MSKYNVSWHKDSKTLVISDTDVEVSGDAQVVSHIVYGDVGEVPDSASHPEPGQHLRNVAKQQGVDDYDLVTVVNETSNDRLDRFVKDGDREKLERLRNEEAAKIVDNHKRPDGTDEDDDAIENADNIAPLGERNADEGSQDSKGEQQADSAQTTSRRGRGRQTKAEDTATADSDSTDNAGGEEGSADANSEQSKETAS